MSPVKYVTRSGLVVELAVYDQSTTKWHDVGGIYAFAHLGSNGWLVHYVGKTNSFQSRIPDHEQWPPALRLGATNVLAMVVPLASDRDKLEALLIDELQPPLNKQLK